MFLRVKSQQRHNREPGSKT